MEVKVALVVIGFGLNKLLSKVLVNKQSNLPTFVLTPDKESVLWCQEALREILGLHPYWYENRPLSKGFVEKDDAVYLLYSLNLPGTIEPLDKDYTWLKTTDLSETNLELVQKCIFQ